MNISATYDNIVANFDIPPGTVDDLFIHEIWNDRYYFVNDFNINKDDVVIDVGAHIGVFSVLAALLGGKVYAYEPVPENYRLLLKNIKKNKVVVETNLAAVCYNSSPVLVAVPSIKHIPENYISLSPSEKFIQLRNTGTSEIVIKDKPEHYSITANAICFTSILDRFDSIDFLKIDIEGYEYDLLYLLDPKYFKKIKKISMEFHRDLSHGQALANYLHKVGYREIYLDYSHGMQGRLQARL